MQQFIRDIDCEMGEVVSEKIRRKIKAYDQSLMLVEVYFKNGAIGEEHTHEEEQISYCIDGVFDYSIGETVYRLQKGDSIFVPMGLKHGCRLISQEGTLLDIFTPYRSDFV